MAKYRVARAHCLGGGIDVYEGQVIELSEKEAHVKVVNGWLTPVPSEPEPAPAAAEPSGSEPDEPGEPTEPESTSESEESTRPARPAGRRAR